MEDWRKYIDQRLRPRAKAETVRDEVLAQFPNVTQFEVDTYLVGKKDYERDAELEYLREEYERFKKKSSEYSEIAHFVKKHSHCLEAPPKAARVEPIGESRGKEVAVMLNSDQHGGLNVDELEAPSEIPNSVYNMTVMENRINYYTEKFLRIINERRKTRAIDDLYLIHLGDGLQGNWDNLNHTKDLMTKQMLGTSQIFWNQIYTLSSHFDRIFVEVQEGNHSRLHKKFPKHENWENLMWNGCIAPRLETLPNVSLNVSGKLFHRISILDYKFLAIHGDGIRMFYKTPYYGIESRNDELYSVLSQHGHPYDYLLMGHFHMPSKLGMKNGTTVMCGSTTGYQPYALQNLGKYTKPSQTMFGVHPNRGLTWHYDIDLSGVGESPVSGATGEF